MPDMVRNVHFLFINFFKYYLAYPSIFLEHGTVREVS